jgi:hypothetical protein
MRKIDLKLTIDSSTRRIEYVVLEDRKLNPSTFFDFRIGEWIAEQKDFPLDSDDKLNLLIIVAGNQGTQSKLKVFINNELKGEFKMFKPFNSNGYGQFNEEI